MVMCRGVLHGFARTGGPGTRPARERAGFVHEGRCHGLISPRSGLRAG